MALNAECLDSKHPFYSAHIHRAGRTTVKKSLSYNGSFNVITMTPERMNLGTLNLQFAKLVVCS